MTSRRGSTKDGALRTTLVSAPATRTTLGDVVAERLREAILNDELAPGQHLGEEEISASLAVSRGPVRDAFLMLEREGLVELSRHRGATVVELSFDDLGEVYSMRSAIEALAVRLAIRRHQPEDLVRLDESLGELQTSMRRKVDEHTAARLDVNFHDAIFQAAHHERLYKSWSNIRMQVYWFLLSRNVASPDWRENMTQNHARILGLIREGDENAAVKAVSEHIRSAYTRMWETMVDQEDTGPVSVRTADRSFLLD